MAPAPFGVFLRLSGETHKEEKYSMSITIRESFTKDAIEEFEGDVNDVEEGELSALLEDVWQGEVDPSVLNLAVLAFVAGRTYGLASREPLSGEMSVKMRQEVLEKFIEFLVDGLQ